MAILEAEAARDRTGARLPLAPVGTLRRRLGRCCRQQRRCRRGHVVIVVHGLEQREQRGHGRQMLRAERRRGHRDLVQRGDRDLVHGGDGGGALVLEGERTGLLEGAAKGICDGPKQSVPPMHER